jgi:hypothetical protein
MNLEYALCELSDSDESSTDSDNDTVQNCNESLADSDPDELLGQTHTHNAYSRQTLIEARQQQPSSGPIWASCSHIRKPSKHIYRQKLRPPRSSLERSCSLCSNSLEQPYHFFF